MDRLENGMSISFAILSLILFLLYPTLSKEPLEALAFFCTIIYRQLCFSFQLL